MYHYISKDPLQNDRLRGFFTLAFSKSRANSKFQLNPVAEEQVDAAVAAKEPLHKNVVLCVSVCICGISIDSLPFLPSESGALICTFTRGCFDRPWDIMACQPGCLPPRTTARRRKVACPWVLCVIAQRCVVGHWRRSTLGIAKADPYCRRLKQPQSSSCSSSFYVNPKEISFNDYYGHAMLCRLFRQKKIRIALVFWNTCTKTSLQFNILHLKACTCICIRDSIYKFPVFNLSCAIFILVEITAAITG